MKRIPTPPIFCGDGGVKDKLTDFPFNYQRLGAPTQGGVRDSDALLTSQERVTPKSENSESPSMTPAAAAAAQRDWFRVG